MNSTPPPHVTEIASWIIYMNIGAVLLLAVGGPILVSLIKRWIGNLVSTEFCQMSQAKCRENMAKALSEKFTSLEECSKKEHGMIYVRINENRENAIKDFKELRKDINDGLKNLTNLLVGHIQKNGG